MSKIICLLFGGYVDPRVVMVKQVASTILTESLPTESESEERKDQEFDKRVA